MKSRRRAKYEVYCDVGGKWRWRLIAPNGRIICDSAEGYSSRAEAEQAFFRVRRYASKAELRS